MGAFLVIGGHHQAKPTAARARQNALRYKAISPRHWAQVPQIAYLCALALYWGRLLGVGHFWQLRWCFRTGVTGWRLLLSSHQIEARQDHLYAQPTRFRLAGSGNHLPRGQIPIALLLSHTHS